MIALPFMSGRAAAVLGLGKTGVSAARALAASGASVLAWDDDAGKRAAAASAGVETQDPEGWRWTELDSLVLSPGIPLHFPKPHPLVQKAREAGTEILSDIALLRRAEPQARLIAITGTNGKSTTTTLIGHILSPLQVSRVGGNLGTPVLDFAPGAALHVLELSSYQLDLTPDLNADIGILLNITPDHLDRHGGMDGYIASKASLFRAPAHGRRPVAIIGVDDAPSAEIARRLRDENLWTVIPISSQRPVEGGIYAENGWLVDARSGAPRPVFDLAQAPALRGSHNHQNAAAALAACLSVPSTSEEAVIAGLRSFPGLPHRQFQIRTLSGVLYVNDSKATNADATSKALASFEEVYWILGGRPKEGGLSGLESFAGRIREAYLIGEATPDFAQWLEAQNIPHVICGTLDRAVAAAHARAASDLEQGKAPGVVLLSPACASWDQFTSFEERGAKFAEYVMALPDTAAEVAA